MKPVFYPFSTHRILLAGLLCGFLAGAAVLTPSQGRAGDAQSGNDPVLSELRESFRIGGKPVPPELFRDFGDGDLADSRNIWITADVSAAIGSNQYADQVTEKDGWVFQQGTNGRFGYRFYGAAADGKLVVVTSASGEGSGVFYSLHILDLAAGKALDDDGKPYRRTDLTNLRTVALGDRWSGEVVLSGTKVIVRSKDSTGNKGAAKERVIDVVRP